jgi:hypothetical protein
MNRYLFIRRLMGPSILLLLGVVALLHQAHVVHWALFVPLLLILIGVLKLAERAALAAADDIPLPPHPWGAYPGAPNPPAPENAAHTAAGENPASAPLHDFEEHHSGGQS